IGFDAFYRCEKLTSVEIPDSVTSIGGWAFGECKSLTSVTLPESVERIEAAAFLQCDNLKSITIKNPECIIIDDIETHEIGTVIYGYEGSTAEEYAKHYNGTFVSLGTYTPPATTTTTKLTTTTTTTTTKLTTTTKPTTTTTKPTTTTPKPTTTTTKQTTVTTTTTKPVTTTVSTTISASSPFEWGVDNWDFLNSRTYFTHSDYYLNASYLVKLRSNLTNTEWNSVKYWKNSSWRGSCYGMSSLIMISKAGLLPYSDYTSGADCLYKMQNPDENLEIESLINYYQLLQAKDVIMHQYRTVPLKSHETNIKDILSKLDTGNPVLVVYKDDDWGGHAVVAYAVNYGSWTWDGVAYQGQIQIIDPNHSESYDDKYCIYFNTSTYNWNIPAYSKVSSVQGSAFNYIGNSISDINCGGYLNDSGNYVMSEDYIAYITANEIASNHSVAKVEMKNDSYVNMSTAEDDILPDKSFVICGESEGTNGYLLKDANAGYKISQDNPTRMDLSIDYENCLFNASSAAGREIIFDNNGVVSVTSESADCTAEMIYNDGYYDTDWYGIKVSCSGADNIILEQTEGGYYLSGNILENVTVGAFNNDVSAKAQFSTDADKVYIYEIDENTVGISIDTDGDGTFETKLDTTESSDIKYGDVNLDDSISVLDVIYLNKYLAGIIQLNEAQLANSDCVNDKQLNSSDAAALLKYTVGKVTSLPVKVA
ncbi:MAG: leucine-rich repeat protein, partial [Ruminococcus sp.]